MKVIDLLNKIANGEEVPTKIRYQIFELDRTYSADIRTYYVDKEGMFFFKDYSYMLNDEVEIIEEDKKIEKINAEQEIERLNNIIKHTDSWIDRTIEIIKQQPSENDTWILERLNGIKQCLKGSE